MSRLAVVPSVIETTGAVEPGRAFEFWRATALAPYGDVTRGHERAPFRARRLVVANPDWILTHTVSGPVGLRFETGHVVRNAPEMVVIGLALAGTGYQIQRDRGARIAAGDISFLSLNRPFLAGAQSEFEEIRLALPRLSFEAWLGRADALEGRCLPQASAFAARLRGFAGTVAWMTPDEARIAVEGLLHLLRGCVPEAAGRSEVKVSREAVAALARAHIERRLHDPGLSPAEIHTALGLSRAHLYRAFAETEGIAAEIRNARLTLAHQRLTAPTNANLKIATIAYACGFTDVPAFNRAFRRRFGLSPGDLRPGRAATWGQSRPGEVHVP